MKRLFPVAIAVCLSGPAFADYDTQIEQLGDDNIASVTQNAHGSQSTGIIEQVGSSNEAGIFQRDSADTTLNAELRQEGDGNRADVEQHGGFLGSFSAALGQVGNENEATIDQGSASVFDDVIVIRQWGDRN